MSSEDKNIMSVYKDDKMLNVVNKFRTYRMNAENNDKSLKESKLYIDRLKEEIHILKEVEKSLRSQASSAQNRLIQLQSILNKMTIISEQQRSNEKKAEVIEQKVEELNKEINKTIEKTRHLLVSVSKECDLLKNNEDLKLILKSKQLEYDLMKIEVESLKKEKNEMAAKYNQKLKSLETEVEKSKSDYTELKSQYDRTLLIYKKQIEDNEQIIKEYEAERKSLLEEFEPSKESKVNFTWADSTVSSNMEDRAATQPESKKLQRTLEDDEDTEPFLCLSYTEIKSSFEKKSQVSAQKKSKKLPKFEPKAKPQLEFLTPNQESLKRSQKSPEFPIKRRLFSTNSNHYIN